MASSTLKGLVANSGKLGYQLWHRPLKMASLVYEREIGYGDLRSQSRPFNDRACLLFSSFVSLLALHLTKNKVSIPSVSNTLTRF